MVGGGGEWHARGVNVAELVGTAAAEHGGRAAFRLLDGSAVTWREVDDRVSAFADAVRGEGVRPSERIALVLPNSVDFAVAFWGALRAGAVVVPANPAYTPRELAHILTDSGAVATVSTDGLARVGDAPDEALPGDAAVICYTSGTTGVPKGAVLTHGNFLSNLHAFAGLPALRLTHDDVLLGLLPFFHIFGLNVILNAAALHGASVLVMDRFSPAGSLEALAEHGVTVAYGAPPVFAAWCAVAADQAPALPALRAAVSGADSLPERVWHAFAQRFGVPIQESYGLTETAPGLTSNAAAPEARPGTVGMALPGVEVRVVAPDGRELGPGEAGEIVARGPNVFTGYHRRPEATTEALDADGWFRTGDLGEWDADGYLAIKGRLKDLVIVSGFNVYPREVEAVLLEHPAVADAAVVGLPDPRTGERVRAVVVPAPGAEVTAEELMAHCRERLARYKLPREIVLTESLPRRATGKISRDALRAPLDDLETRQAAPG